MTIIAYMVFAFIMGFLCGSVFGQMISRKS